MKTKELVIAGLVLIVISTFAVSAQMQNETTLYMGEEEKTIEVTQIPIVEEASEEDIEYNAVLDEVVKVEEVSDPEQLYINVEQCAQFPGGEKVLMKWISDNLIYPESALKNEIEGRVIVQFVIETDGTVSNPRVTRGVDDALDKEAIRLIKKMPKWKPGKNNGVVVRSSFTLPVTFRLNRESK